MSAFRPDEIVFVEHYTYNRRMWKVRMDLPALVVEVVPGGCRLRFESDHVEVTSDQYITPAEAHSAEWFRPILGTKDRLGERGHHFSKREPGGIQ